MLWLLFEAILAALKQTVGLGKNTLQTGREAAEFSWLLLRAAAQLFLSVSPQRKPQARSRKTLLWERVGVSVGDGVWGF